MYSQTQANEIQTNKKTGKNRKSYKKCNFLKQKTHSFNAFTGEREI